MTKNENIPLFLHIEDAIATVIIKNDLLHCDSFANRQRGPSKAFAILQSLYSSQITNNELPNQYKEFFSGIENITAEKPYHCLIGEDFTPDTHEFYLCLELNIEIRESKSLPIYLTNFRLEGKSLTYTIPLSTKDAFFIFSNICSNTRCNTYEDFIETKQSRVFDKEFIKKNIPDNYKYSPGLSTIDDFVLCYLADLQENILNKSITPKAVLNASGTRLLVLLIELEPVKEFIKDVLEQIKYFDKLTITELAMYFTLLECLRSFRSKQFPTVELFFVNNVFVIEAIQKKIEKDFSSC